MELISLIILLIVQICYCYHDLIPISPINQFNKMLLLTKKISTTFLLTTQTGNSFFSSDNDIDKTNTNINLKTEINNDYSINASEFVSKLQSVRAPLSDEIDVTFNNGDLGIGIVEVNYKGFPVVKVSSINSNIFYSGSTTSSSNNNNDFNLRIDSIITRINNVPVDGQPFKQIVELIKSSPRPLKIRFRDPSKYFELIDSSTVGKVIPTITTSYLPANTIELGKPEEIITVERLEMPPPDRRNRASNYLDVMEIQYVARIVDSSSSSSSSSTIVDSSAERSPPGSSSKSIYYVLGQQNGPPGNGLGDRLPNGLDITLKGMVIGEKRKIILPPSLAYGQKGLRSRGIPPNTSMMYIVKCISIS